MKLRTKIALVNVGILVFAATLTLYISEKTILANGNKAIEQVRQEEIALVEDQLEDVVTIAYSIVDGNYKSVNDKALLKEQYGSKLKNFVDSSLLIMAEELQFANTHKNSEYNPKRTALDAIRKLPPRPNIVLWVVNQNGLADIISSGKNAPTEIIKKFPDQPNGFIYNMDAVKLPKMVYFASFAPWKLTVAVGISASSIMDDAISESKEDIRSFVYDEGLGYVFVNNMQSRSVVHPFLPEIEGQDYSNITDSRGKKYVPEMVKICREKGEGFLQYYWAKPVSGKASLNDIPKISFVKLFKPWGWIIGSGAYIDMIDDSIALKQKNMKEQVNALKIKVFFITLCVTLAMIIFSFIFAGTITRPIAKLIEKMSEVNPNDLSASSIALKGFSEVQTLGDIYNRMLTSVHKGILDIRETTATKEKLESELKVAQGIQMSIIPKMIPEILKLKEIDIFARLKTARQMGGDFYDFFLLDEDKLCFAAGDVSNKGVAASLFMAVTKTLLRAKANPAMSAGETVTVINQMLCGEDNSNNMFMTFFLAILDLRTGNLNYCNANFNPAYLIRDKDDFEKIQIIHGEALGISAGNSYQDDTFKLDPDDMVVLFSDGVTETVNPRMKEFKDEKFREVLSRGCHMGAHKFVDFILEELDRFSQGGDQPDDITVLVMRFKGNRPA